MDLDAEIWAEFKDRWGPAFQKLYGSAVRYDSSLFWESLLTTAALLAYAVAANYAPLLGYQYPVSMVAKADADDVQGTAAEFLCVAAINWAGIHLKQGEGDEKASLRQLRQAARHLKQVCPAE